MGAFDKALGRLNSSPLEAVSDTLAFETIDTSTLASRLELLRHGAERGAKNEPPTNSATLDSIERSIITEIGEYQRKSVDRVTRQIEAYSARLRAFDFEQARVDIISAIAEAKANFVAEVHQGANELFQKRRGVIDATKDVESFKAKHRIERQAHLPNSRMFILATLVVLLLVEAIMNGALFSGGLAGGFLEGIAVAVGIAFLNVVVGFGIGLLVVRFILYRNILFQLLAALGFIIDLALIAFFNLGVARFRTALSSSDPDAALISAFGVSPIEVFQRLGEITGFQSYVLVGVGILFHVFALIDGFKYDDPYPFYGKYWRKRDDAENDYAQTKEALIQTLTDQRDTTIKEMGDASRTLSTSRKLASRIAENRALTFQRFNTYVSNLEEKANQLLAIYREANREKRSSPPPNHFYEGWKFESHEHSRYGVPESIKVDDDIAKRTQEDLENGIKDVSEKFVEAVTTYKKIETVLEKDLADAQAAIVNA